jgi:hypothetical protein
MATQKSVAPKGERQHKATWARDKIHGGYCIRVIGPHASKFAGRTIPVVTRDDRESMEELTDLLWSGIDEGTAEMPGTGKPAALYGVKPKPRDTEEAEF